MTPEESQIIRDVFAQIRSSGPVPNDPQARAAITQELIANPDAGIGLVQLIVGLEHQRAQLEQERDQLAAQINASRGSGPTSGGLFGRTTPAYSAPPPPPQPQYSGSPWAQSAPPPPAPSPWGASQPQAPAQPSIFRSALGSAAGVAGGLFAFEALRDVFGGRGGGGLFGGGGFGGGFGGGPTEYITENTYIESPGVGGSSDYDSGGGFDTSSDDGSSFGGGDDSSFG